MWHLVEGDLHAYLDGALPLYPEAEAERIRDHLETCDECAERLRAEQEVRARAGQILDAAGPAGVEPPPFEEVRRRARSDARAAPATPAARLRRLAWVASVVVALGAGWFGARVTGGPALGGGASTESLDRVPAAGAAAPAPAAEWEAGPTGPTEAPLGEEQVDQRAAEQRPESDAGGETGAVAPPAVSGPGRVSADAPVLPRPATPVRTDSAGAASRVAGARDTVLGQRELAKPMEPEARGRVARADSIAAVPSDVRTRAAVEMRRMRSPVDTAPSGRVRATEERMGVLPRVQPLALDERVVTETGSGQRLVIPGLEIASVEWRDVAAGVRELRIVQRLPDDTASVELRFVSVDDAASLLGVGAPPPWWPRDREGDGQVRQVVERLGPAWVLVRGRIQRERLEELLARLR